MTPVLSVVFTEDELDAVDWCSAREWGVNVKSVLMLRGPLFFICGPACRYCQLLLGPCESGFGFISPVPWWQPADFAGAVDAALCSTPSVGRRLSRVLAAFTENSTTRGRRPSGQLMTTAFTCRTKTPEDTQTRCKRRRQVATLDKKCPD